MAATRVIPTVPLIDFIKHAADIVKNPLPFHSRNFEEKGDSFMLKIGVKKQILFSRNAGLLKHVLQKNQRNYVKSEVQTKNVAKYIGNGLLTSEGEHWRLQRKLLQPTFHKKQLAKLLAIMHEVITEELEKIPKGVKVDVEPYFGKLAFQVVAKSLFSGDVDENTINRLREILLASQQMLVRELRQPFLVWWFHISGELPKHLKWVREARDLLAILIEKRKKSGQSKNDLLDLFLKSRYEDGTAMPMEKMIDELMVLFVAGHETTSSTLIFACQLLAKHPTYQDKIFDEAKVIGNAYTIESFVQPSITKRVIEETMRLYPSVYFIDRMNVAPDAFQEYSFEPNTPMLFSLIEIHRHHEYWQDALAFKPERFIGPANQYSDHYFPFGGGPRMCIGNNFAMFEMQMVLLELIKRVKIAENDDEIDILPMITLKPKNAFLQFNLR